VSSKLSTRARTLSQRRKNRQRNQGEGVDLAGQDQPLKGDRESGLWVPAGTHREYQEADDGEEEEDEEVATNGEERGREEERATEA